jgi:hypothetical protein
MFTHSIVWYKARPYVRTYEEDTQTATLPFPSAICQLRRLSGIRNNYEDRQTYPQSGTNLQLRRSTKKITQNPTSWPIPDITALLEKLEVARLVKQLPTFLCNSFNSYVTENTLLQTKEIPAVYTKEGTTQAGTTLYQWRTQEFVRGGGFQQIQLRTERTGIWGRYPLVWGSGGSCNSVQEISIHIVKFS